jgi:hypothetical protein
MFLCSAAETSQSSSTGILRRSKGRKVLSAPFISSPSCRVSILPQGDSGSNRRDYATQNSEGIIGLIGPFSEPNVAMQLA